MSQIKISEIFGPTIQGEGALIGQPTVFVRTGGCDYRCSWCDTMHAVNNDFRRDWYNMDTDQVFRKIEDLSRNKPLMVTLSGGNPAIQPFDALIHRGHDHGYRFNLETQGSIVKPWFKALDVLTLSPKPPSSGMDTDWDMLDSCVTMAGSQTKTIFKIVVKDDADYGYAREVIARYPSYEMYLQPCNDMQSGSDQAFEHERLRSHMRWLIERVLTDGLHTVRVLPQLHVMLWGNERGV